MRYGLVFLVFLLSTLLMKGIAMPSQLTIQNLPTVDLSFSTLHLDVDKKTPLSEHQNLVAAIKDHDLYDLTEQMELKDEWSKLLYWGAGLLITILNDFFKSCAPVVTCSHRDVFDSNNKFK